jgi:hypothetical protein
VQIFRLDEIITFDRFHDVLNEARKQEARK